MLFCLQEGIVRFVYG